MNASTHISSAERMGGALGRVWKKWRRLDDRLCRRLVAYGLADGLAKVVLWAIKLIVLGALFYAAFWVALILAIALAVAGLAQHADFREDEDKPEWRDGHSGFGLYDQREWRHDMGGPDES